MKVASFLVLPAVLALTAQAGVAEEPPIWADVSVIFVERCVMCHSAQGAGRGLRLDTYDAAVAGSINGPVLLPGDARNSELIRRLKGQSQPRMPFLSYALTDEQIDLIARWIDNGLLEEGDDPRNLFPSTTPDGVAAESERSGADQ